MLYKNPHIESTLYRLGMSVANLVLNTVVSGEKIELKEYGNLFAGPYSKVTGILLYLANTVRPSISFTVARLDRFCLDLKSSQWIASKRVLRYLKKIWDLVITYR